MTLLNENVTPDANSKERWEVLTPATPGAEALPPLPEGEVDKPSEE